MLLLLLLLLLLAAVVVVVLCCAVSCVDTLDAVALLLQIAGKGHKSFTSFATSNWLVAAEKKKEWKGKRRRMPPGSGVQCSERIQSDSSGWQGVELI